MGTYEELKAAIQQVIRTNGNNEITGALLQNALLSIVNVVGANATFAGIATPNTNPGTADQNVFYLATEAGMYVNFGGIVINKGEAVILSNKTGNWVKTTSGFATQQQLTELELKTNSNLGVTRLTNITKTGDSERFDFFPTNKVVFKVSTNVDTKFYLYICKKGETTFNVYNNYQVFKSNEVYSIEFNFDIVGATIYFQSPTSTGSAEISLDMGLILDLNDIIAEIKDLKDSVGKLRCSIGTYSVSHLLPSNTALNHKIYFGDYIKDFLIDTKSDVVKNFILYARFKGSEEFVAVNNYYSYSIGKEYHITLGNEFDAISVYVAKQSVDSTIDVEIYANMAKDVHLLETEIGSVSENTEANIGIVNKTFELVKGENISPQNALIKVNLKKGESFRVKFNATPNSVAKIAGLYDGKQDVVYKDSLDTNVFYEFVAVEDTQDLSVLINGTDIVRNTSLVVELYKGVINDSISVDDKLGIAPIYQFNLTANTTSGLGKIVVPIGVKKDETFKLLFRGNSITGIAGIYAYNGNKDIGTLMYSAQTNQEYQFIADYEIPYITLLINGSSILDDTILFVEVKRGWSLNIEQRLSELEWKENQTDYLTIKGYASEKILEAKNSYNVNLKQGTWLRFAILTKKDELMDSLRVNVHYVDGSSEALAFNAANRKNIIFKKDVNKIGFLSYDTPGIDRDISLEVDMIYNPDNCEYNQPIPLYYFENDYLPNKVARIKELISECAGNGDIFIFSSDEHWDRNAQNSVVLQRYLFNQLNVNKLIDGGDTKQHLVSEELVRLRKFFFSGRKFYVTGNHEYLDSYYEHGKYPMGSLDNSIAYQFNMSNDLAHGNLMRNYYYVDFPLQKIRYIILNAYQQGEEIDNGNGKYTTQATGGYEQEQLTWLSEDALNLEDGWGCLMFSHTLCSYNSDGSAYIQGIGLPLARLLLNHKNSEKIIAFIHGHIHRDAVVNLNDSLASNTQVTNRTIPVIITTCDACSFDDLPGEELTNREVGTITEQAFDVCVLDRTNRKITAVRIGGLASENFSPVGTLEERVINY